MASHVPPSVTAAAEQRGALSTPVPAPRGRVQHLPGRHHPLQRTLLRVLRHRMGAVGLAILLVLIVCAIAAPFISPYDRLEQHSDSVLQSPSARFWLGTDQLGRDLLTRIIWGSRNSLIVGVLAVLMGAGVGIATGTIAGFVGGWVEEVLMSFYDALLAFPGILLGIAVVTVLGPGMFSVAYALALGATPVFARLARSTVIAERGKDYVLAARAIGARDGRIMWRHVLPNSVAPLIFNLAAAIGFAVLAESGLSFLGLGTRPPEPSWGGMLADARGYLRAAPWYGIMPGVALALLLLALHYIADALRDALDPRRVNG